MEEEASRYEPFFFALRGVARTHASTHAAFAAGAFFSV